VNDRIWYKDSSGSRVFAYTEWMESPAIPKAVLLACIPGYSLDEFVFQPYAQKMLKYADTVSINPFLHIDDPRPLGPTKISHHLANFLESRGYEKVIIVGQSLGFIPAVYTANLLRGLVMKVIGMSPVFFAHNVLPLNVHFANKLLLPFIGSRYLRFSYGTLLKHFSTPSMILFLRSLVGNHTYDSEFLRQAVARIASEPTHAYQMLVEPFSTYVANYPDQPPTLEDHLVTVLSSNNDKFIRFCIHENSAPATDYYDCLVNLLGIYCSSHIRLPGGHEGFLECLDEWIDPFSAVVQEATERI
jgi:hypothetical protein